MCCCTQHTAKYVWFLQLAAVWMAITAKFAHLGLCHIVLENTLQHFIDLHITSPSIGHCRVLHKRIKPSSKKTGCAGLHLLKTMNACWSRVSWPSMWDGRCKANESTTNQQCIYIMWLAEHDPGMTVTKKHRHQSVLRSTYAKIIFQYCRYGWTP